MIVRIFVLLGCLALPGCREEPAAARDSGQAGRGGVSAPALRPPGHLGPGDSLFERLDTARVVTLAPSVLPAAVRARAQALAAPRPWTLQALDWRPGETMTGAAGLLLEGVAADAGARRWSVQPPFDLDLRLGDVWLEHEGRRLADRSGAPEARDPRVRNLAWTDPEAGLVFTWLSASRRLTALGTRPPGTLRLGWERPGRGGLAVYERWLDPEAGELPGAGDPPRARDPVRAADLVRTVTSARSTRPALCVTTPSRLEFPVAMLGADTLHLALNVLDLSLVQGDDGRLRRGDEPGDGAVFAVEVTDAEGSRRVWSGRALPGETWEEHAVDLRPWLGRAVTLALVTEPGPSGQARFDFARWGELRLSGSITRPPSRPHVVLVDVDTLRADRLGCYGGPADASPRLDAWAASRATRYADATTTSDWTLPATVSLLTGLAVSQHGVLDRGQVMQPGHEPLALRLGRAGYLTWGRTDGAFVGPWFGAAAGFDRFAFDHEDDEAEGWREELARLAERGSDRPVFLFLHTYMVHAPYRPTEGEPLDYDGPLPLDEVSEDDVRGLLAGGDIAPRDWDHVNALYDQGVRRMDDVVGAFLEGLDEAFGDEPYLVIVTSDHGEELGDRGGVGHGHSLHSELLQVPLLVRFPDGREPGVDETPASLLDLVPTVLAAAGLEVPEHLPGRDLGASTAPSLRVAQRAPQDFAVGWEGHTLLVDEDGTPRLFHTRVDPGQRHDLAADQPRVVSRLVSGLREFLAERPPLDLDGSPEAGVAAEALADLEALGYLGGG